MSHTAASLAASRPRRTAALQRIRDGEGYIYLARPPGKWIVKIGFSLTPIRRVEALKLRLINFVPGTFEQERELHKTLGSGSWTHCGKKLPREFYPTAILSHPAIPEALRAAQASRVPFLTGRAA